jgi:hypothetical protein
VQEILGLLEAQAIRPGQHKPIPFQSKHVPSLKRNVWFALKRPVDKSRTGYLCIWPEKQSCVYISGDPPNKRYPVPRIAALNLRIDPQFYNAGFTVFEATLISSDRTLHIEDVLLWKGRDLLAETFSARWLLAKQWIEHYCICEPGPLTLDLAGWISLSNVKPGGSWEFIEDDVRKRRLLWITRMTEPDPVQTTPEQVQEVQAVQAVPEQVQTGKTVQTVKAVKTVKPSLVAVATRPAAAGPDQWDLTTSDGTSLGRALVRTLQMSTALRGLKHPTTRLEVIWNSAFNKWEAVQITMAVACHSGQFVST